MAGIYGYGNIQLDSQPICVGSISLEREFEKFTYKYFNSECQQFLYSECVDLDSIAYYITYSLEDYPVELHEAFQKEVSFSLSFTVYEHESDSTTDYSFDNVHVVSVSTVAIGQPLTVKFVANPEGV